MRWGAGSPRQDEDRAHGGREAVLGPVHRQDPLSRWEGLSGVRRLWSGSVSLPASPVGPAFSRSGPRPLESSLFGNSGHGWSPQLLSHLVRVGCSFLRTQCELGLPQARLGACGMQAAAGATSRQHGGTFGPAAGRPLREQRAGSVAALTAEASPADLGRKPTGRPPAPAWSAKAMPGRQHHCPTTPSHTHAPLATRERHEAEL